MLTMASTVKLNNGIEMPMLGLGTWQLAEGEETRRAVTAALQAGYRLIDTAAAYGNERSVGQAVAESGLDRSEVFITSKVWNADQSEERTPGAFRESLARLGMDYLDLYLIHWPAPAGGWQGAWRAMVPLLESGHCRAIGVSNFEIHHLRELQTFSSVLPAVNQVPFSPFQPQRELLAYCRERGIAFEGYSPLRTANLHDPRLLAIANKHKKTPVQILLRWPLQHGVITIPKSARPERIRQNADIFDFALDDEDMATLDALGD